MRAWRESWLRLRLATAPPPRWCSTPLPLSSPSTPSTIARRHHLRQRRRAAEPPPPNTIFSLSTLIGDGLRHFALPTRAGVALIRGRRVCSSGRMSHRGHMRRRLSQLRGSVGRLASSSSGQLASRPEEGDVRQDRPLATRLRVGPAPLTPTVFSPSRPTPSLRLPYDPSRRQHGEVASSAGLVLIARFPSPRLRRVTSAATC